MQRFSSSAMTATQENETEQRGATLPKPSQRNRFTALDLMRGFIMIIMSWDHTKDIFASAKWSPKHQSMEGWQGPFQGFDNNFWFFFARTISNLCAPGFFFTMGMSMSLFTIVRKDQHWDNWRIAKHFLVRGWILLLVGRLVDPPFMMGVIALVLKGEEVQSWTGGYGPHNIAVMFRDAWLGVFEVMTGLGLTMMCGLFVLFPSYYLFVGKSEAERLDSETWEQSANRPLLVPIAEAGEDEIESGVDSSNTHVPIESQDGEIRRGGWRVWFRETLITSVTIPEVMCYFVFLVVYAVDNIIIVAAQGSDFYLAKNSTFPDVGFRADSFGQTVSRFFLIPGALPSPLGRTSYPVIPWIALTSLGIGMGFSLKKHTRATVNRLGFLSVFFLCCFVLVRSFGGKVGNYRGLPRGDGQRADDPVHVSKALAFFITSKYPPSLAYAFLFLGIDMGVIFMFFRTMDMFKPNAEGFDWRHFPNFFRHMCNVFGEVPLFFYIVHFWILGPLSGICAFITDDYKISLPACALLWLALLSVLFPTCKKYGEFKNQTPKDSWWRYL